MKYIDKTAFLRKGHAITDSYLETECRIEEPNGHYHYQNVDYSGSFGTTKKGAKAQMLQLAVRSQENLCCYCMRSLGEGENVTLEHVIPQSCCPEDFKRYTDLNISPLTEKEVIRTADFTGVDDIKTDRRPHTVTFENLTASCGGKFPDKGGSSICCNNKRGEKPIYPMFYIAEVEDELDYMDDGSVYPNERCSHPKEYVETIQHVRLNCSSLKDIRRLWHLFRSVPYEKIEACLLDKALREETLLSVLFQNPELGDQDMKISYKFMTSDDSWRTLLLYRWFHQRI